MYAYRYENGTERDGEVRAETAVAMKYEQGRGAGWVQADGGAYWKRSRLAEMQIRRGEDRAMGGLRKVQDVCRMEDVGVGRPVGSDR